MSGRFSRFADIVVLLLLAAVVAEPYVTRLTLSDTTPRVVTARGDLSEAEQTIVAIFQKVSPSVVHVVGRQAACARRPRASRRRQTLGRTTMRRRWLALDAFSPTPKVTVDKLIEGWSNQTAAAVRGRHVLAIQDT